MVCICFQATYVIRVVNISVNDTVQIKMSDDLILLSFNLTVWITRSLGQPSQNFEKCVNPNTYIYILISLLG